MLLLDWMKSRRPKADGVIGVCWCGLTDTAPNKEYSANAKHSRKTTKEGKELVALQGRDLPVGEHEGSSRLPLSFKLHSLHDTHQK